MRGAHLNLGPKTTGGNTTIRDANSNYTTDRRHPKYHQAYTNTGNQVVDQSKNGMVGLAAKKLDMDCSNGAAAVLGRGSSEEVTAADF